MRSVEESSNAMALDGIIFEVRRPSDYIPLQAATLGPSQPDPNLNLAAVGLTSGSAGRLEGLGRIFVGGLPYHFTEAQGAIQPKLDQESVLLHAQRQIALQRLFLQPVPTKIVFLNQVVNLNELKDDNEYQSIVEEMRTEGEKFGSLANVVIPRPKGDDVSSPGFGKVFFEHTDIEAATKSPSRDEWKDF